MHRTRSEFGFGRMIRRAFIVILILAVALGAAFVALAWRSAIAPVDPPIPSTFGGAVVERGAGLAAIGGCISCHTAPGGTPYAGGLPLETPFGTIYGTNITPDPKTGIGHWSEAAFVRAMREGVRRDGRHLYPAFPYDHYTRVADDELRALYAFFMTREPVHAETPENELIFPLNVRMLIAGWKLLFFDAVAFQPDPGRSPEWNRGAYLAEGLGHCGSCHTPRNFLGAPKKRLHYAGGTVEGWHAPALDASSRTPVPWSVEALEHYLTRGVSDVHEVAAGPMTRVVESLADAPPTEVRAIAVYIASQFGEAQDGERGQRAEAALQRARAAAARGGDAGVQKTSAGANGGDQAVQEGRTIYEGTCRLCHVEAERAANASSGEALHLGLSTSVQLDTPANLIRIVLQGIAPPDGERGPFMPGYAGALTERQLAALVAYLRADFSDRPAWENVDREIRRVRESFAKAH
jgi:mono/diheme cytochrome c family protein